jgi:hypothetical protein
MKHARRSARTKANGNHSSSALPIAPTRGRFDRGRFDVDSFVGLACVLLLPIALWFA